MDFNQAVWFLDIDRCYSPSPTPSTTSTVTPSPTPSMTPSPTPSNTPTPTPSATVYAIQLNGPANSASEACNWTGAPPLLTIYVRTFFEQYQIITCNTTSGNIAVYTTPQLTTPFNGQGSWYSTKNSSQPLSNCSFIINSSGIASNFTTCPAPSPSVTVSPSPTPSTSELANCDFTMSLAPDFSNQITIYADTNGSNCTSFNVETTYNNIYVSNSAKVNDLPSGTIVYTDVNLTTHIIGGGPTIFTSSLNPTRFTFQIDTNGVIYNRISCP